MSRKILWVGSLLLPLVLLAALFIADKYRTRGLVFSETAWDFGQVNPSKELNHTFTFKNRGDSTITIKNVVPDCGCTVAFPERNVIGPGEYGSINVTLNPVGKSKRFGSSVLIETDDDPPNYTLSVTAYVVSKSLSDIKVKLPPPSITVEPMEIDLGTVKMGKKALYRIVIGNSGEGDLFLTNIGALNEAGTPLSKRPIKKGEKVEITAYYDAVSKGRIDDYLGITSTDPKKPVITVHITGQVN